jgi:predicted ATPase
MSGGTAEVTSRQVPTTLAEAISDRLGFLPAPVRDVLQAAALLGGEFAVADLAVLTGTASAELAAPLADARAAGVLAEQGTRLALRHPLIRAALYDDLPFPVRAAWHRDAARALHNTGAGADQVAGNCCRPWPNRPIGSPLSNHGWSTG